MKDVQISALFEAQLVAALAAGGVTNGLAKRDYQPRAAGPNSAPTLYFHIIADRRYGWPARNYTPGAGAGMMAQGYRQQHETTVQITGYADETPAAEWTAGDLAALAAAWCASDEFRAACQAFGAGVLRVSEIRRPYIEDERGENAMAPSFDVVITHKRTLTQQVHQIDRFEAGIRRV